MVNCPACGEENPAKFRLCGYCGAPLVAPGLVLPVREVRKTVTIVFCDLKGSTALGEHLDPEALHEVKERYFTAMAAQIVRHGGKIEKYIGDAIMAVFGLPQANEDDALRAVRAAVGMQNALVAVNQGLASRYGVALANRTGILADLESGGGAVDETRLASISVPVTIVAASLSPSFLRRSCHRLSQLLPQADTVVLEHSGHWAGLDARDEVVALLRDAARACAPG